MRAPAVLIHTIWRTLRGDWDDMYAMMYMQENSDSTTDEELWTRTPERQSDPVVESRGSRVDESIESELVSPHWPSHSLSGRPSEGIHTVMEQEVDATIAAPGPGYNLSAIGDMLTRLPEMWATLSMHIPFRARTVAELETKWEDFDGPALLQRYNGNPIGVLRVLILASNVDFTCEEPSLEQQRNYETFSTNIGLREFCRDNAAFLRSELSNDHLQWDTHVRRVTYASDKEPEAIRSGFAAQWSYFCPELLDTPRLRSIVLLHRTIRHMARFHSQRLAWTRFTVHRATAFEESVMTLVGPDLGIEILVSFLGDEDGDRREFFTDVARQIHDPEFALFEFRTSEFPHYTKISGLANFQHNIRVLFKAVGRFLAISLLSDIPIGVIFPVMFYAHMLGVPLELKDIAEDEPELFRSLSIAQNASESELAEMALEIEIHGVPIRVTVENRAELIHRKVNWLLSDHERVHINSIGEGLFAMIPRHVIIGANITPSDLKHILYGNADIHRIVDAESYARSRRELRRLTDPPPRVPERRFPPSPYIGMSNREANSHRPRAENVSQTASGLMPWHTLAQHVPSRATTVEDLQRKWEVFEGPALLRRLPPDGNPQSVLVVFMLATNMDYTIEKPSTALQAIYATFAEKIGLPEFCRNNAAVLRAELLNNHRRWSDTIREMLNREPNMGEKAIQFGYAANWEFLCPGLLDTPRLKSIVLLHRALRYMTRFAIYRLSETPITIHRATAFDDSVRFLLSSNLGIEISARFVGENGIGAGVKRDFFTEVSRQIYNPEYALFELRTTEAPHYTKINGMANFQDNSNVYFEAVGRFLGLSILNDIPIGVTFPVMFYAHVLGVQLELADIAEDEPALFNSLSFMHNASESELIDMQLEISIDGVDIAVTVANRAELIRRKVNSLITEPEKVFINSLSDGLFALIPRDIFIETNMTPLDLKHIMYGNPNIDIFELERSVLLEGYTRNSPQITWLFTWLHSLDDEMRGKFLRFVTSNSRLPLGGFTNLARPIEVHFIHGIDVTLPSSHTCFHQLDLPRYSTEAVLRERMQLAIDSDAAMGSV